MEAPLEAVPGVVALFRRACYDCHSNETNWPWYAGVAPASWLVANDVSKAREHLNFSTWENESDHRKNRLREEIWEQLDAGRMPLWYYSLLHPNAQPTGGELDIIRRWTTGEL